LQGRNAADCGGNADIGHELHHDLSTSSSHVTSQRWDALILVRNFGAALPSVASAATVTICRVRVEHGTGLLCAARVALRVRLHCGFISPVALR
jgi:hypothetical protein